MYSMCNLSGLQTDILSNFSFLNEQDSGISVVETRSIQYYLFNNLKIEFDYYITNDIFLNAVNSRYNKILERYYNIRVKKIFETKKEIKKKFEFEKTALESLLKNKCLENFF